MYTLFITMYAQRRVLGCKCRFLKLKCSWNWLKYGFCDFIKAVVSKTSEQGRVVVVRFLFVLWKDTCKRMWYRHLNVVGSGQAARLLALPSLSTFFHFFLFYWLLMFKNLNMLFVSNRWVLTLFANWRVKAKCVSQSLTHGTAFALTLFSLKPQLYGL